MRILGIDPGLRVTGFGLIETLGHNRTLEYITSGSIVSRQQDPLPLRLKSLFDGVSDVIARHAPEVVAVEIVFVNINPQSTLLLGQARGAAIAAAVARNLPVAEYTALQIKQAVVGHGHASKQQVQHMVMRLLKLAALPAVDPADALACAIRHAHDQVGSTLPAGLLAGLKMKGGRLVWK